MADSALCGTHAGASKVRLTRTLMAAAHGVPVVDVLLQITGAGSMMMTYVLSSTTVSSTEAATAVLLEMHKTLNSFQSDVIVAAGRSIEYLDQEADRCASFMPCVGHTAHERRRRS